MENKNLKLDKNKIIYFLLIAFILVFFTFLIKPTLGNSAIEKYESWRQSDTYSVAKIYDVKGIDLLRPEFYYDGIGPHIIQLELELLPMMGVFLKNLFDINLLVALRSVSLFFFLMSAVFLYLLARLFVDQSSSVICLLLYLTMPLNIMLSRAIMPEALIMFFYLGGVYFIYKWYKFDKRLDSYLSAVFLSLAIIEKIPVMFFGLVVIYLYLKKYGLKSFKKIDFYLYGIIALLPTIIYMLYMQKFANHGFVSDIASKHIFSKEILNIFSKETIKFHLEIFRNYFTLPIFTIFCLSLIKINKFSSGKKLILPWIIFMSLEVMIICGIIKFNYYYVFYTPIVALAGSFILDFIYDKRQKIFFISLLLVSLFFMVRRVSYQKLTLNEETNRVIEKIRKNSNGRPIALNTIYPMYINELDRYGARLDVGVYDYVPKEPREEIEYWLDDGIKEFLLFKSMDNFEKYSDVINGMDTFKIIFEDDEMIIYDSNN